MLSQKLTFSILFIAFGLITACAQKESSIESTEKDEEAQAMKKQQKEPHPYGGWYCPDNLGGFPPVNVISLASVPVVNGRMPTKEETQNGTALMYFDPAEYPTAKPLQITLPKLARFYSENTKQVELVVIIQAVVIDEDTIVGFRYIDGGNGTSWFSEVDILTDKEVEELGSTPFVFLDTAINASKQEVWQAIAKTDYAKKLAQRFNKEEFFKAEWTNRSRADLSYDMLGDQAHGYIMSLFGNLYLQIDYNYRGNQFVEKVLVIENEDGKSCKIQVVFGPYTEDYGSEEARWNSWLQEVKTQSETE